MSGYTKGPWRVGSAQGYNANTIMSGKEDLAIASVFQMPLHRSVAEVAEDDRWTEGLANARLIAAAPDLFEALKKIVGAMREDGYSQDLDDLARAALAKAVPEVQK